MREIDTPISISGVQLYIRGTILHPRYNFTSEIQFYIRNTILHPGYNFTSGVQFYIRGTLAPVFIHVVSKRQHQLKNLPKRGIIGELQRGGENSLDLGQAGEQEVVKIPHVHYNPEAGIVPVNLPGGGEC